MEDHLSQVAQGLALKYKTDFIQFMIDMNKDIANDIKDATDDFLNKTLTLVNTCLVSIWLSTELAHYDPEIAKDILANTVETVQRSVPGMRKIYLDYEKGL